VASANVKEKRGALFGGPLNIEPGAIASIDSASGIAPIQEFLFGALIPPQSSGYWFGDGHHLVTTVTLTGLSASRPWLAVGLYKTKFTHQVPAMKMKAVTEIATVRVMIDSHSLSLILDIRSISPSLAQQALTPSQCYMASLQPRLSL
jgi:hypothetical protein